METMIERQSRQATYKSLACNKCLSFLERQKNTKGCHKHPRLCRRDCVRTIYWTPRLVKTSWKRLPDISFPSPPSSLSQSAASHSWDVNVHKFWNSSSLKTQMFRSYHQLKQRFRILTSFWATLLHLTPDSTKNQEPLQFVSVADTDWRGTKRSPSSFVRQSQYATCNRNPLKKTIFTQWLSDTKKARFNSDS